MFWVELLLVCNLGAAAVFAVVLFRQRRILETLQGEVDRLMSDDEPAPERSASPPAGTGARITIQLLNPLQLAAKQSRFADRFGTLTPSLIRRIVYQKAATIVRQQLLEHGAEAEVTVQSGT